MGDDESESDPFSDLARRVATRRGRELEAADDDGELGGGPTPDERTGEETPEESAPLSDLARRVDERRASRSTAERDGLFEEMSAGDVDEETMWASLTDAEDADANAAGVGTGASAAEAGDEGAGHDDHVVPKAEFCEQCPYLADPPELACDHGAAEIVEVVDADNFRVRHCPMVDDAE
ncbi:hypothetical protein SAMN04488063_2145 [Halopelagius inordinatus]|uniref:DUF8135 domain-containing protein n=1 Tax=Halopelagius inordinatus TaxID=553467 RepID=A0A1I2S9X8_9EURY|nr:hypothetical protein [Halopelagius inordinatus]SFG46771.1 hypothetical protein SAMN04488063_2145 [Halopelagius inordinatus]